MLKHVPNLWGGGYKGYQPRDRNHLVYRPSSPNRRHWEEDTVEAIQTAVPFIPSSFTCIITLIIKF